MSALTEVYFITSKVNFVYSFSWHSSNQNIHARFYIFPPQQCFWWQNRGKRWPCERWVCKNRHDSVLVSNACSAQPRPPGALRAWTVETGCPRIAIAAESAWQAGSVDSAKRTTKTTVMISFQMISLFKCINCTDNSSLKSTADCNKLSRKSSSLNICSSQSYQKLCMFKFCPKVRGCVQHSSPVTLTNQCRVNQ